jgi:hypothetical protein
MSRVMKPINERRAKYVLRWADEYYLLTKMTNKMQLCKIIYCSLTSLRASSDNFAHLYEHLNCIYSFWYYSRMWLPAGVMYELELQFETRRALKEQ